MKTLINIFAAIGFVVVITVVPLAIIVMFFAGVLVGGDEVIVQNEYVSPNQEFRAVDYIEQGGGAAGYCYKRMSIIPFSASSSDIEPDHEYFMNASCGAEYSVHWQSDEHLVVSLPKEHDLRVSIQSQPERFPGRLSLNYVNSPN